MRACRPGLASIRTARRRGRARTRGRWCAARGARREPGWTCLLAETRGSRRTHRWRLIECRSRVQLPTDPVREQRLLKARAGRRRTRVRKPARALPPRAARALLPDARLGLRRRRRAAGRVAARLARARALRGPQLAALVALHDRHQHLPDPDPAPAEARAAGRLRPGDRPARRARASRSSSRSGSSPTRTPSSRTAWPARRRATSSARASSWPSSPRSSTCRRRQRAVLILREVLGFSAKEVAESLETTVAVGQQRAAARPRVDRGARARAQPAADAARARRRRAARRSSRVYVDAWERNDVETVVAMLTEDAAIAMPPLARAGSARAHVMAAVPRRVPDVRHVALEGRGHHRQRPGRVRRLRLGRGDRHYLPFALNVLTFRGDKISDVVAFAVRAIDASERERYHRWVDEPLDAAAHRRHVCAFRIA